MKKKMKMQYPNSDRFLHRPLDKDAFNLSLLKNAPRVAALRIIQPQPLPETESEARFPTALNSPNALQATILMILLPPIHHHEEKSSL
ncbi:hypothetical protein K1719_039049 [Acacia pycnantha]|nr:hypothetical protein K1719_039049 [Acacia pycnantha]